MSDKQLPIGTKIYFIRTIEDGPDEYGPGNHYATKGDNGVVTGHGCHEGHCVKWEHWPFPFGARLDIDFKVVETNQPDTQQQVNIMSKIEQHIEKLGEKAKDKVTGLEGVITSVTFDLYGCIQGILQPPAKDDGTLVDGRWIDIDRLELMGVRVMDVPNFNNGPVSEGKKGPAEKPLP